MDRTIMNYSTEHFLNSTIDPNTIGNMPRYYPLIYKLVGGIFVTAIFIVGLLGNLMVVIVVARTKGMRTPTNCYLVSLAVADLLCLISSTLPTILEYFLIEDEFIFGHFACSIMVFSQYLGVNVSAMSISAFTVERYIAICYPMKAHSLCTVRRAFRIIAMVWVFGLAYCAPWLALTTIREVSFEDGTKIDKCTFKLMRKSYLTYYMADFIIFYIAPLCVTIVLYALILRVLFTSIEIVSSTNNKSPRKTEAIPFRATISDGKQPLKNGSSKKPEAKQDKNAEDKQKHRQSGMVKSSGKNSRHQVVKMLLIVVCMFALLWMPYRGLVVYNSFAKKPWTDPWFILFCRLMVYTNSAINPILYNAMSVKFRKSFKQLLLCNKGSSNNLDQTSYYYVSVTNITRGKTTASGNTSTGLSNYSRRH